jgi:N-acetylmuramoyl-L-alanine amidase
MPEHTVVQGECITSIAQEYGFFWETLWNLPDNAELKRQRQDPNVLQPGDVVIIPEKRQKQVSCASEQTHRFQRRGCPAILRLRLLWDDEPRANESYVLEVDGEYSSGTTDGDGRLEHPIAPNARRGRLLVGESQDEYVLDLGHIDPVDEISGVQSRLNNLGFICGETDGDLGPKTESALRAFQRKQDLPESGEIDDDTKARLVEIYGS